MAVPSAVIGPRLEAEPTGGALGVGPRELPGARPAPGAEARIPHPASRVPHPAFPHGRRDAPQLPQEPPPPSVRE